MLSGALEEHLAAFVGPERDRAIADFFDDQLAAVEREPLAAVVGLDAPTRGARVGLADHERRTDQPRSTR